MKKLFSFLILGAVIFSCASPVNNKIKVDENGNEYKTETATRTVYKPIYYTSDSIIQKTKVETPREMKKTGKIYIYGDYIFINEVNKGIHVIDNSDPKNPIKKAFIAIEGNVDMAIRDSILYADSYQNLLAINITDLENIKIEKIVKNVFNRYVQVPYIYDYDGSAIVEPAEVPKNSILVDYDSVRTEEYEKKVYVNQNQNYDVMILDDVVSSPEIKNTTSDPTTGTGGSMARFTIIDKYLYVLSGANIQLLDIENPADPSIWNKVTLKWDIETIFPYKDKIFIGSASGMYILNNTDPSNPELVGTFGHIKSCDPIVATDSIAYVTLRGGSSCGGTSDQLDILDIKDITNPKLIKTYSMNGPYGLAVKDTTLFICDGEAGLKVYNVKDTKNIINTDWIKNISTHDVIVSDNLAIVISKDGLRQFDITDINDLKELSYFSIN